MGARLLCIYWKLLNLHVLLHPKILVPYLPEQIIICIKSNYYKRKLHCILPRITFLLIVLETLVAPTCNTSSVCTSLLKVTTTEWTAASQPPWCPVHYFDEPAVSITSFLKILSIAFPIILLRSSLISTGWTFGFLLNRIHQHVVNKASINWLVVSVIAFAQKMKFSIKDFSGKCDHICIFLCIWSHLLKKSLMENFIFCAVCFTKIISVSSTGISSNNLSPSPPSKQNDQLHLKFSKHIFSLILVWFNHKSWPAFWQQICIIWRSFWMFTLLYIESKVEVMQNKVLCLMEDSVSLYLLIFTLSLFITFANLLKIFFACHNFHILLLVFF